VQVEASFPAPHEFGVQGLRSRDLLSEGGWSDCCRELGIGIVTYSPLGRGFFTGKAVLEKLQEGDARPVSFHLPVHIGVDSFMWGL
jgi:hypothetical protein